MSLVRRAALAALTCLLLSGVPASAATTIDTGVSASNDPFVGYQCQWGYPDTATFGQTVTVPSNESLLEGFSFHVMQFREGFAPYAITTTPATIAYRAYVYAWDGSKATGLPLWTSGPQTHTTTGGSPDRVEVPFTTAQLPLTPGGKYVLFVSVDEDYALNSTGDRACLARAAVEYAGGSMAFLNRGSIIRKWTVDNWTVPGGDLAFKASFSAPPLTQIYDFDGFYAPVNNRDANGSLILNQVRAGQAIPVRFSLGGDYGLDVFAEDYPKSEAIECDSDAEVDGVEQTVVAGSSSLSYASGSNTYTYVWKTDTNWDDSCRQLVVRFNDGTTARANFKFKP